jgi:hypothetical protein
VPQDWNFNSVRKPEPETPKSKPSPGFLGAVSSILKEALLFVLLCVIMWMSLIALAVFLVIVILLCITVTPYAAWQELVKGRAT